MALFPELRPRRRIEAQLLDFDRERGITEEIQDERKQHWVAFARGGLYVALALLIPVALLAANGPLEPMLLSLLLALRGGWLLLVVWEDRFVVTDSRIFRVQGVFNQRSAAMSLSRIVDFTMEEPALGQVLNYGHLVFENAAQDQGLREIRYLRDVGDLNKLIQELVFQAGGGPAKHKKASAPTAPAAAAAAAGRWSAEQPPGPGGWGTLVDPDATGEIPRVPDED